MNKKYIITPEDCEYIIKVGNKYFNCPNGNPYRKKEKILCDNCEFKTGTGNGEIHTPCNSMNLFLWAKNKLNRIKIDEILK